MGKNNRRGKNNRSRRASARAKKQPRNPFNGQFMSWRQVVVVIAIALVIIYAMATA